MPGRESRRTQRAHESRRTEVEWFYNRLQAVGRDQAKYGFILLSYLILSWLLWFFATEEVKAPNFLGISVKFPATLILGLLPFVTMALILAWAGTFYGVRLAKAQLLGAYGRSGGLLHLKLHDIDTEHNLFDWWDHGNPWRSKWPPVAYVLPFVVGWISILTAWWFMGTGTALCTAIAARAGAISLPPDLRAVFATVYSGACLWISIACSYRIVFKRIHEFRLRQWTDLPEAEIDNRLRRWRRPRDEATIARRGDNSARSRPA